MADDQTITGPDLTQGIALADLAGDGAMLVGHCGDDEVLLVRRGDNVFAVGARCTHYSGPLNEGLLVGNTVRCPWHHACFDLATGEALRAPAFNPLPCWSVTQKDGKVFVGEKRAAAMPVTHGHTTPDTPQNIVIIGGGCAGFAAAHALRGYGYGGSLVMLSDDSDAPVDRPNLSKDYLAGKAPEEWMPLQDQNYYTDQKIDLRLKTRVTQIDAKARHVALADGTKVAYDRLLLATGAEPIHLKIPGMDSPHVHMLRSFADCRKIIENAQGARKAVVFGSGFIGLEAAAALTERGLEVHVVSLDQRPLERVMGPQMGDFLRVLHEEHGVIFHLGQGAKAIAARSVQLEKGTIEDVDLVIVGIGVRPRTGLAEAAGIAMDRGIKVNDFLETSVPGIFAAGDIARWPDPHSGQAIRVEHWVVAGRQGRVAAANMLGQRKKFDAVPFFWSQHYDIPIAYVGHAEHWDEITVDGDIAAKDCLLRYKSGGRTLAVASIFRDTDNLLAELAMERGQASY